MMTSGTPDDMSSFGLDCALTGASYQLGQVEMQKFISIALLLQLSPESVHVQARSLAQAQEKQFVDLVAQIFVSVESRDGAWTQK